MEVILSPKAFHQLERIAEADEKLARIIRKHIGKLPSQYHLDKQLKGSHFEGLRRHRVGDYRILYRVEHRKLIISIVAIAHRREAYDV